MSEDSNKPFVPKTAMDFQKLKLERLMANPDKPVVIPEMPKERKGFTVPEFVRNVMGSSAGAGSGEFHVYRHLRRKEYTRQKMIEEKAEQERLDEEFRKKLEENKRKMEERTEKKRAKRLRKKAKLKEKLKGGKKQNPSQTKQDSSSEESDTQSESEQSESKEQAESSETCRPSIDSESSICDSSKDPEDSGNTDHAKEMLKSNIDSPENVESSET